MSVKSISIWSVLFSGGTTLNITLTGVLSFVDVMLRFLSSHCQQRVSVLFNFVFCFVLFFVVDIFENSFYDRN